MNVRERAKESYSLFYITLISIISSLALSYYFATLEWSTLFGLRLVNFIYMCKLLATFLMILLVWHEYVMSTLLFRWVIGYTDSIIPFLFGLVLFGAIRAIHMPTYVWLAAQLGFILIGWGAYWNQYSKVLLEPENENEFNVEFNRPLIRFCKIIAAVFFVETCVSGRWSSCNLLQLFLVTIVCLVYIGFSMFTNFLRQPAFRLEKR